MKKVTLILSALALVLGLSQCKKQETPAQSGEKQHIVLTANNGNDGSKVAVEIATAAMNLTWEKTDEITVSGGASGTLTYKSGAGTPNATFEGDITIDRGDKIEFTVGSENYLEQDGTIEGENGLKSRIYLVGTSDYKEDGNYNVSMELPYAVLLLDLSTFGTTEGTTVTISDGTNTASVENVTVASTAMYVALPVTGTGSKEYTLIGNGKTATKTWTLEKNVFYTKAGAEGAGTGDAIVIEPDAPATHKFTVGMDGDTPITVEFAPGNLYYNGEDDDHKMNSNLPSGWNFYEHQWNCYPSGTSLVTESMEISLFTWGYGTWSKVYNTITYQTGSGVTMTDWGSLAIGSDPAGTWRTLTIAEWKYLLGKGTLCRDNASSLRAWKEFDGGTHKGLVILPDGTENPSTVLASITETTDLATYNAVFLPAAGNRNGTSVYNVGSYGYYWSGTPAEDAEDDAYNMYFYSGYVNVYSGNRNLGYAVRLVR